MKKKTFFFIRVDSRYSRAKLLLLDRYAIEYLPELSQ